jgi:hypothetical protein
MYVLYSVHAATVYDDFIGTGPGLAGARAADLESDAASRGSQTPSARALRRALSKRSSFTNPFTGSADLRREIGRASGAVPYLPPATLP